MKYQATEHLPGVWHIADVMGVCFTLLVGRERALLVDAGYGLEDTAAFVHTLTDKPMDILLTHGHHDHALGAMHFPSVWLFPEDDGVYRTYSQTAQRRRVADSAEANGIAVDRERFLTAPMAATAPPPQSLDLGGMTAQIILCPGHTPGSAVVYIPERGSSPRPTMTPPSARCANTGRMYGNWRLCLSAMSCAATGKTSGQGRPLQAFLTA